MSYTKQELLDKIADNLPNNTTNSITPFDLRDVFMDLLDTFQESQLITYDNADVQDFADVTTVKEALDLIADILDDGATMTAAQIRDALQTLSTISRLPKSAIFGADRALNRRGKIQFDDLTVQNLTSSVKEGDWFEYYDGGSPTESYANGDVAISLQNDPLPPWDLENESLWRIYRFSKLDDVGAMTAEDIRDALETLTADDMLDGDKVKYDADFSVNDILDRIVAPNPSGLPVVSNIYTAEFLQNRYYVYEMTHNLTITIVNPSFFTHFPFVKIIIKLTPGSAEKTLTITSAIELIHGTYNPAADNLVELEFLYDDLVTAKIYQIP